MQQPPLLPEQALDRVLRMSRMNGMSVMFVAGFFALLSALARDFEGAIAGLVVAGAGAMEVHGGTLLRHRDPRGIRWLINSQLVCLAGILVYCAVRLNHPYLPPLPPWARQMVDEQARAAGVSADRLLAESYISSMALVAVLSTIYQGSMAIYYARRKRPVLRALEHGEV